MSFMTKLGLGGLAVALSLGTAFTVAEAHGMDQSTRKSDHGSAVSAVAKSDATTGEAHGDAVSAAAKVNAGMSGATHGNAISTLATTTTLTGAATGEAISDAASANGARMSGRAK